MTMVITCELLLYFHQEKRKVTEALLELRRIESDTPVEVIKPDGYPNTDSEVAQFIQPRFLGVLAYMDSILVSRSGCESGKRHALLTLPELIRLMGKVHITPVRFKVLATLRSALKLYGDSFPELVCFAWRAFVLNVSTLGPLLSTIVVSLLPLLDQHSVEISSVFHICIVDNLEAVSGYLAELYFLPDTPPIHQIYTLVQKELAKLRNLPVKDQLAVTLRMATHENADVRLLGLHKLRTELSLHRQHMVCLIRDHDNMDPFILKLLDALISGCKDPNEGVQLASAQCLGEIGAVDPGLLPNRVKMEVEEKEISFVINSEAFVIRALKEFVRAFQAATTTMDSYAFGIQEEDGGEKGIVQKDERLFKMLFGTQIFHGPLQFREQEKITGGQIWGIRWLRYHKCVVFGQEVAYKQRCVSRGVIVELLKLYNVTKSDIWKQLSDSTKEIISPFRDSRYKPMQVKDTNIPHPIFGSTHGTGFKMWAVHWVSRLIPAVTDEFVRKVFSVCQLGLKNDLQTLLFFLPYIVLYAILGATKSQSVRIAEEMSTVLTWSDDQPATEGDTPLGSILTTGSSVQDLPVSQEKSLTHTLCAKTIYQLFDFLYRWLRETKQKIKPNEKSALSLQYDTLHEFLKKFSKLEISEGSFKCREYTRALLFLEEYITENPNTLQSYLPSLGIIYYHLHDPDSLRGIIAIHETEPTAQEMILFHEVTGKLQDAAACYEQLGQENVGGEDLYKAMVQCYLGMDQPLTALKLAQGLLNSGQCVNLVDLQAEAMLSLSQFPQLEQLLAGQDEGLGWGASLGQALLHLSQRRRDLMVATLNTMRQSLVRSLAGCSVSNSGYRHSYDVIVKLHIITELEKLGDMVLNMLDCQSVEQSSAVFARVVREELDNRLSVVQPACRVLQPVLCVRRVVLSLAQQMFTNTQPCRGIMPLFNTEIGNSWLKSIEIARKSGHFQQAYTNILTVEPYKPKGLFVEKAKLLWAKCEPEAALNTLQWGIEHHFPDATEFKTLPASERLDDRKLFAEAKLLMAVYNDENVNIDMETNVNNYRSAMEVCRNWEKSVVCFAQYKYKYLRTFSDNSEFLTKTLEYQVDIIYYFGKSLEYGCEYIYQSMPRMLSIWLDFGTQLAQDCISIPNRNTANLAERRATMDKMTTLIETFIERLPTYMFMTAFSQLISRICHPLKDCYKILRRVIIKIIIAYPQQALWMFLSVYKK
ncbi:hypothetical protein J6590_006818 [Homalodisca vitripennis]|nr:hypothetical protein J6590_006818 [Homalodisca vitripennis]